MWNGGSLRLRDHSRDMQQMKWGETRNVKIYTTQRQMPHLEQCMMTFSQMTASQMLGAENVDRKLGFQELLMSK